MKIGYIKLYRKITDNLFWKDKPFSKGQAWIDLLLMVNHKPNKVIFRDSIYEVKRGQKITSESKLSKVWGWSRWKVNAFLKLLEQLEMITIKVDKRKTVITVLNYDSYQTDTTSDFTTDQHETTNRPTSDQHKQECIRMIKNEKKKKDILFDSPKISFNKFWDLYDKKVGNKTKIEKKWNNIKLEVQEDIMIYVELYKMSRPNKQYRKNPLTFLNNKAWEDELIQANPKPTHKLTVSEQLALLNQDKEEENEKIRIQ